MAVDENDYSPEAGAVRFWDFLRSDSDGDRNLIGGLLHPRTRNRVTNILKDFDSLDRPALCPRLEPSGDESVLYASIIEGAETVDGHLVEDRPVARYLTMKWEPTLQFWSVYHYGPDFVRPDQIPD